MKPLKIPEIKLPFQPSFTFKKPRFKSSQLTRLTRIAYSSVAIGFLVAFFLVIAGTDNTPVFPDPAVYDTKISQDAGITTLSTGFIPEDYQHQTLNLLIGGTRLNNFYFEDVQVGDIGLNTTIRLTGGGAEFLVCETLVIDGLVASGLVLGDGEAYNVYVDNNRADGNSFSLTLGNTNSISFGSDRGSLDIPYVENSDYDQIIIDTSSAESTCSSLSFKNVKSYGAPVELRDFKVGNLIIRNSIIGDGTGINTASFIIEDTITASNLYFINNSEEPIDVR